MRLWRKTIILAFAAFGAYRAWELLSPKGTVALTDLPAVEELERSLLMSWSRAIRQEWFAFSGSRWPIHARAVSVLR